MRGIARVGDRVFCPSCKRRGRILTGSRIEYLDGRPISRKGDRTSLGPIITSSRYRYLDMRGVARLWDKVRCRRCGGLALIITASRTEYEY